MELPRKFLYFLLVCFPFALLVACGDTDNGENQTSNDTGAEEPETGGEVEAETEDETEEVEDSEETQTSEAAVSQELPEGFPSDFPLPDPMYIEEVRDESDADSYSYTIRFNFEPDADLNDLFHQYDSYANGLGYNIFMGGEEYFGEGIFQFGATDKMSTDSFIVTMQPEGDTFGDITYKRKK